MNSKSIVYLLVVLPPIFPVPLLCTAFVYCLHDSEPRVSFPHLQIPSPGRSSPPSTPLSLPPPQHNLSSAATTPGGGDASRVENIVSRANNILTVLEHQEQLQKQREAASGWKGEMCGGGRVCIEPPPKVQHSLDITHPFASPNIDHILAMPP